jgi:hypothetical protein
MMRIFVICTPLFFPRYNMGHQINENETGRACSSHGRNEKYVENLLVKHEGKRLIGSGFKIMEWVHVAEKRTLWRNLTSNSGPTEMRAFLTVEFLKLQ